MAALRCILPVLIHVCTIIAGVECVADIYIACLLPMTGKNWPGGNATFAAASLAVEHVNNRSDVLPNHRLNLLVTNTDFRVYTGVRGLYAFLTTPPVKHMVLGAANSELSEAAAIVSELYNLISMSYASVSPLLSDKGTYPRFFRTSAPDTAVNPARIEIIKYFGWKRVATIHHSRAVFDAVTVDLENKLKDANISLITSEVFQHNPAPQVLNLKKHDARIIFALCNSDVAFQVMCEAYKTGIFGRKYAWFFPGWYDDNWWKTVPSSVDCTAEQIQKVAEGYIASGDLVQSPSTTPGISGYTHAQFESLYNERVGNVALAGANLKAQGYDAIWAMALALNQTQTWLSNNGSNTKIENFTYSDTEMANIMFDSLKSVSFDGVKSPIVFDSHQDPVIMVKIERVQGDKRELVGIYYPSRAEGQRIAWSTNTPIKWTGDRPPVDSTTVVLKHILVPLSIYTTMCILAGLGISMAIMFFIINMAYRKVRVIKMSSPHINNLILVGCVIMYSTVIFQELNQDQAAVFCKIRSCTLTIGFATGFGALFSKTWRIHVIFSNKKMQRKVVKDGQLLVMVIALLCVDVIIILVWEVVDPIYARTFNTTSDENIDGDILFQHQVSICDSHYKMYFVGAVYVVQGLLMLFGTFLAWETRKVKIAALNDSQNIGLCIYNVIVLCSIGCILSFVLARQVVLHYTLISGFLVFGTTMTQCIIFIPKIIKLRDARVSDKDAEESRTGTATQTTSKALESRAATVSYPGSAPYSQNDRDNLFNRLRTAEAEIIKKQHEIESLKAQLNKD